MSSAASLELCEELHRLSGLDTEQQWARSNYSSEWTIVPSKSYKAKEFHDEPGAGSFYDHLPAYDYDDLFSLLPEDSERRPVLERLRIGSWQASLDNFNSEMIYATVDDLPLDALCKLVIGLYREGILA